MKTKFIYVVLMALFLGSQMTLSAQNKENKERKQHPTPEQTYVDRQSVHGLEDFLEVGFLVRQQFVEGFLAAFYVLGQNHFAHSHNSFNPWTETVKKVRIYSCL